MIKSEKRGNIEIVSFSTGKLNAETADEVRDYISNLFSEPNSKVVISFKGIDYIDSTGFGSLLSILRVARDNYGKLKICCIEPQVLNLFNMLHLHTIFDIHNSIDECINSLNSDKKG